MPPLTIFAAESLAGQSTTGLDWWRWLGLFFVFAGLLACWILVQRGQIGPGWARRTTQRLNVLETRSVGNRTSVSLVEVDGETFLLAHQSGGGLSWQRLGRPPARSRREDRA